MGDFQRHLFIETLVVHAQHDSKATRPLHLEYFVEVTESDRSVFLHEASKVRPNLLRISVIELLSRIIHLEVSLISEADVSVSLHITRV